VSATLFEEPLAPPSPAGRGSVKFTVYGKPVPQGSTRAFIPKGWKRAVITTDNTKLKPWRQQITATAIALAVEILPREVPVVMGLRFYFEKPPSAKKRIRPTVKPDVDKLIRGVLDSLTGVLYVDDSQVVRFSYIEKLYGLPERVEIEIGGL